MRNRKRSKQVDINDFNKRDNHNIVTSDDFFCVFREEVGIYLFEANFSAYYERWLNEIACTSFDEEKKLWFEEIKSIWSGVDNSPSFYKKRAEFHFTKTQNKFQNDWVPLYVGKCQKVQSRVYEHIEGISPKTYGMKLSHRDSLKKGIQFRVSYSSLNELDDESLYELVKVVENKVRTEFNPIIGKQ